MFWLRYFSLDTCVPPILFIRISRYIYIYFFCIIFHRMHNSAEPNLLKEQKNMILHLDEEDEYKSNIY